MPGLDAALASASRALDEGRPAEALAVLDPMLAADPDSIAPLTSSIAAARMTGDIARAQALADRLAALMPNNLVSNATARALAGRPLGFQPAGLDRVVPVLLIDERAAGRPRGMRSGRRRFGRIDRFTEATVIDGGGPLFRRCRALLPVDRNRRRCRRLPPSTGFGPSLTGPWRRSAWPPGRMAGPKFRSRCTATATSSRCHQDRPNDRVAADRRAADQLRLLYVPDPPGGSGADNCGSTTGCSVASATGQGAVDPGRAPGQPADRLSRRMPITRSCRWRSTRPNSQDGRLTVNGWLHVA